MPEGIHRRDAADVATRTNDDMNELFCSELCENWFRTEIFPADFVQAMDEKWPNPNERMWDRIADWMDYIMQSDFFDQGHKMKFFTVRSLCDFGEFWTDIFQDKKQIFYCAMYCDENGNRLGPGVGRSLDGQPLEESFIRTRFRSPVEIAPVNSEVSLESFKFGVQVSWMLDILQNPRGNEIFPPENFAVFWRLNRGQQEMGVGDLGSSDDSALESDLEDMDE